MKLSLVFELLLIFVLLAFAASKSVKNQKNNKKAVQNGNDDDQLEENSINKYCKCVEAFCNCCRDFALPVVNLNGPGCASLMYLNGDKMSVSLSFGKKVITNRTLSSRKPSPVCMPLPGGISKFCGRVYNIARAGEEFRACLGLELQSKSTVEAAVRVSCFKFGPRGVTSEPADPLPLVPQEEKEDDDDDDDDDDDEDDDYGLGDEDDDDDDDDDDGDVDAVNDVDSTDYTGFSLLGEDLIGDLFGSTGGKKSNKNKKKQAPVPSTTTTKRPRPSRRPSRRPGAITTTLRPTRTTTVKIRPVNRRPTRRPIRRPENGLRPTRRPNPTETPSTSILTTPSTTSILTTPSTTSILTTPSTTSIMSSTSTTTTTPETNSINAKIQTTERSQVINTANEDTFEPILIVAQKPTSSYAVTTTKSVTGFEDTGLEMSLAHITGQLSVMPVVPLATKESSSTTKVQEQMNYEKVQTVTFKAPTTISVETSSEEGVNDDMIQIVQSLDSHSEENVPPKESISAEESRAHLYNHNNDVTIPSDFYGGIILPKKKNRDDFHLDDLDVLDLTQIGESIGDQLGIFGGKRRQNRDNKDTKVRDDEKSDEYDDVIETLEHSLLMRKSGNGNENKKDRRRQNKMMRGEWSQV